MKELIKHYFGPRPFTKEIAKQFLLQLHLDCYTCSKPLKFITKSDYRFSTISEEAYCPHCRSHGPRRSYWIH